MNLAQLFAGPGLALALLLSPALPALLQDPPAEPAQEQLALERLSARIAGELEKLRGREFERPFEVRVASAADLIGHAKERTAQMTPPEKLAAIETLQKMLGLLPADLDLMAVTLGLLEDQVGGFYDPGKDTFYLMEGFTGLMAELILAHELTHALDDQLFDLDAGLAERSVNSDVLAAYHAVVEGSGMVMMFRWLLAHPQALSPEDLAAAMPSSESLNRAPAAIWKPLLFAYLQGQSFLEAGRRTLRKQDRKTDPNIHLDQAFLSPPRSTEQILHPHKYWDPEQLDEPRAVSHDRSRLPEEWKLSLSDTLGELMLALVVEEPSAIDLGDPLAMMALRFTHPAAQGWDGDEVLLLERADGAWLMVHAVVLDGPEDAGELQAALEAARERIEEGLRDLAGEEQASGLAIWLEGSHLVRWLTCTGLELEPALKLARSLPVTVGPDPLTSPHEDPLAR